MALLAGYGPAWVTAVAVQPVLLNFPRMTAGVNECDTVDGPRSMPHMPRRFGVVKRVVSFTTTAPPKIAKNNHGLDAGGGRIRGYGDLILAGSILRTAARLLAAADSGIVPLAEHRVRVTATDAFENSAAPSRRHRRTAPGA